MGPRPIAATRRACPELELEDETRVFDALARATLAEADGDSPIPTREGHG